MVFNSMPYNDTTMSWQDIHRGGVEQAEAGGRRGRCAEEAVVDPRAPGAEASPIGEIRGDAGEISGQSEEERVFKI